MQVCSGSLQAILQPFKITRVMITLYHQAWSYVYLRLTAKTISAVVQSLVKEVLIGSLPFLCRSENLLSKSFHSLLDCCSARMCYITLWHAGIYVFSFENLWNLKKKKKKMQRVFPGQESSAPWKFGAPVSQGLAEVTDRAAAEPGRLGFIGPDLSVRRGLQASA